VCKSPSGESQSTAPFADLKAAGIVNNHCALKILIDDQPFGDWSPLGDLSIQLSVSRMPL
jgi:hypothetical protein